MSDNKNNQELINNYTSYKQPCNIGQDAYIPYWEEDEFGNKKYGYDKYTISFLCGCGDIWTCAVTNSKNQKSCNFEPNTEIFFTENDVNKMLNKIKRMEDPKKLNKWKRRDLFNV